VYNYVRAQCANGETPADDAPAFVVEAVEHWLSRQTLSGVAAITVGEIPDPRLTFLVLHAEDDSGETDFVHAVVVPHRRLAEAPPKALRRLFESLYGGRLDRVLPRLRSELAGLPYASLAPRVLRHFATEADVESLRWVRGGEGAPAPRAVSVPPRAPRVSPRWLLPGAVVAGALALLFGVIAGAQMAANLGDRAAPTTDETALQAKLEALELRVEELASALADDVADRRRVLARVERRAPENDPSSGVWADALALDAEGPESQTALAQERVERAIAKAARGLVAEVPPPVGSPPLPEVPPELRSDPALAVARELAPDAVTPAPSPPAEPEFEPELALPEPESLPSVAASPPTAFEFGYRVVVDTARVRSEPSGESATRGLLARGTRLVALAHMDDWIEIEPPEGFLAPSWVHASLVEERP
jgi:hypothetical protein